MRLQVGLKKLALLIGITGLLFTAGPFRYSAAVGNNLLNRYVRISDSVAGRTNVTYEIGFSTVSPGLLGSVEAEFCSNDPFPGTSCTVPPGLNLSSAVLASQSGTNDFTIDAGQTNAHRMVFSRTASVVAANTFKFELSGVANPTSTGAQYIRLRTYSAAARGGSVVEEAGVAFNIMGDVSVSTQVPQRLEFCVGVTIVSVDCSNTVGDSIDMGTLKTNNVTTATSQFVAGTNADNGYTVTVNGNSLTSGNNVLKAMSNMSISLPGTNQFGMNLRQNISPVIGQNPTGTGSAAPVGSYNIPDNFIFNSGDTIASTSTVDNYRKFTASYIANIDANQPGGYYATTLTFVALANF